MGLETVVNIADLVKTNPTGADPKSQGDDHIRNLKTVLLNGFAGFTGAVRVTGVDGGAADAYTLTPANALPAYGTKMVAVFAPTVANTGACTLNISGLGVKALWSVSGEPLVVGDLTVGNIYSAFYDGTRFRLTSVTKNYADQLAFSSALPAQAGNAGKFITTDGVSASWGYAGISAVHAVITASTVLAGTYLYVPVQMAALGQSITLPDATTLAAGGPQYIIDNTKSSYATGIRNKAGVLLMGVAPGGEALVSLKDASTLDGAWSITGSSLVPGLISVDSTLSTTFSSAPLPQFVALDDDKSIHFATVTNGFAAFVVDNAGKVLSTPVTVALSGAILKTVFKVSPTTAIAFYLSSGSSAAVVLTLTGSSPSHSLSIGTPATTAGSVFLDDFVGAPRIAQLSSTLYVVSLTESTNTAIVAISVSGATVTIGAQTNIITALSISLSPAIYALTAATALVIYLSGVLTGGSGLNVNAVVVSVAGVSTSVGAPVVVGAVQDTSGEPPASCLLSPTKAIVLHDSNSFAQVKATAITIAGTVVAVGAALSVEVTGLTISSASIRYTGNGATRYNPHLLPLSGSIALLWYLDAATNFSRAAILSESGGALTNGTILYRSFSTQASNLSNSGAMLSQSQSDFIAAQNDGVVNSWKIKAIPHKIAGTAITVGAGKYLPEIGAESNVTAARSARLGNGDYLVSTTTPSVGLSVFRSNGDEISYRGAIPTPNLSAAVWPLPAVSANRVVLLLTYTNGLTTAQLRVLNVEIAA